jgi:peptide/nickel transport system substrate-binding protein
MAATSDDAPKIAVGTPEPRHKVVWVTGIAGVDDGLCNNGNLYPDNRDYAQVQNPAFLTACNETGARCNLPGLASSWEQSEDHRTWTFHLREDVTWSDGIPSTADDHVFTLNVVTHPGFGSTLSGQFRDLVGFQAFQDGEADHLAGVNKISDYSFSIEFVDGARREPAQFSQYYLLPYHRMKDRTVQEWIDHPIEDRISVGPYYFTESVCGDHHILRANPYFYLGKPQIDEWTWRLGSPAEAVAGVASGEIDVLQITPLDEIPHLNQVEHLNVIPDAGARGYMFLFNQNSLPLKVRRAMQQAMDRQGIIDRLWLGYGWTYPCRAQPQGIPLEGVIPDFNLYDPDEARALLEEAVAEGWDPDTEIRLYYYYEDDFSAHLMDTVADMWETIGINAKPELLPPDKVVEVFYEKDDYDVLYGCCADTGNREHYTELYFYYKGGLQFPDGFNATRVDIPELDEALETINETFDRGEEIAAYQTACTILGEQVVDVPLWMSPGLYAVNTRLKNTTAPDGMFNKYVHTWWIEE